MHPLPSLNPHCSSPIAHSVPALTLLISTLIIITIIITFIETRLPNAFGKITQYRRLGKSRYNLETSESSPYNYRVKWLIGKGKKSRISKIWTRVRARSGRLPLNSRTSAAPNTCRLVIRKTRKQEERKPRTVNMEISEAVTK